MYCLNKSKAWFSNDKPFKFTKRPRQGSSNIMSKQFGSHLKKSNWKEFIASSLQCCSSKWSNCWIIEIVFSECNYHRSLCVESMECGPSNLIVTQCDQVLNPKVLKSYPKISHSIFYLKSIIFKIVQKWSLNNLATFVLKFAAKNFHILPNLVTLLNCDILLRSRTSKLLLLGCGNKWRHIFRANLARFVVKINIFCSIKRDSVRLEQVLIVFY